MRANAVILIVIGLLLLVGTAAAEIQVQVSGNESWLVAGTGSSAAYTITVINNTSPIQKIGGATVTFSVPSDYGTISPTSSITNGNGQAFSTFTVGTKSGVAPITATISYPGVSPIIINQNIDHGSPFYEFTISPPLFTYPAQGTVATEVPFKVSILDKWGNPIDNRRGNHLISLHASSALSLTEPFFVVPGNMQDIINQPLDANGTFSVNVRLTTKSGSNKILMDPFEGKISTQIAWITAMADAVPYSMTGSISPSDSPGSNSGTVHVGYDQFTLDYYLYDKYGNAIENGALNISTNLTGETVQSTHSSDTTGLIRFYYGPKISVLTANITAIAVGNSSVKKYLIANFVSSDVPSNLFLVVSPQTMASWEVEHGTTREAKVLAAINDEFGIPIAGKEITFAISYPPGYNQTLTGTPSLSSNTAYTNSDGIANVTFYSGSIITNTNDPNYSESMTGACKITATYNDGSKTLTSIPVNVEWKNYAYLSAEVNVTPRTVFLNDTIDITIRITGDGYKMVARPISVVLDLDTTSSMNAQAAGDKTNQGGNGLDRFANMKNASNYFVGTMNSSDQLGLVTYGYYGNNQYWQPIANVSINHDLINGSITNLTASGSLNVSVKDSIDGAITKLNQGTRPANDVGAIITLGDSSYNSGDLAPMVSTAKNNNVRIYTIQYVSSQNGCNTGDSKVAAMALLANQTDGIPYCCTNSSQVIAAMADIKRNLSEIAGVNTSMDLDFKNVQVNSSVNNTTSYMNGTSVFDYVFIGPEISPQPTHYHDRRTNIIWTDDNMSVINQTDEWKNYSTLNFNIGNIKIKKTWETTFRFTVKQEGIIDLFGNGSSISYNGGSGSLKLPLTEITSINNTMPEGLTNGTLRVTNLRPKSGTYNTSVLMEWNLNSTGNDTVTETYYYNYKCTPTGYIQFGERFNIPSTGGIVIPRSTNLDITKFPEGEYCIKVVGRVKGIPDSFDTGAFNKTYGNATVNILLQ